MKRMKLDDRLLPKYSRAEDWFNAISHMVGVALGIVATVLCVVFAAHHGNVYGIIGGAIFGVMMTATYAISSVYHALSSKLKAKKVMQILDHCSIFMLIAGSYTPYALCSVREYNTALGWVLFGVVWAAAALGIALNSIDLKRYSTFSMICYLAMGWCIIVIAKPVVKIVGTWGFLLTLLGGIAYTVGAVLYALGSKKPWMHSIFHIFTVIGSLLHFFAILLYVVR